MWINNLEEMPKTTIATKLGKIFKAEEYEATISISKNKFSCLVYLYNKFSFSSLFQDCKYNQYVKIYNLYSSSDIKFTMLLRNLGNRFLNFVPRE